MSELDKSFKIEDQWQAYLEKVGLSEDSMPPAQKRETKRAFVGAIGQMLVLLRDELTTHSEEKASEILEDMMNQVGNFWLTETQKQN